MEDFYELVKTARTCREFSQNPLKMQDLKWLVKCSRVSPSGRNAQDLRFILVTSKKKVGEIFANARWAKRNGEIWQPAYEERPTAFIAVMEPEKPSELSKYDAGIACQTIQLAATSKGWGCCIIFAFNRANVREIIEAPHGYLPILLLALGFSAQKTRIEDMETGAATTCRNENGVHIVPKRPLKELILSELE